MAQLERAIELAPGLLESYREAASIHIELQQPQRARDLLEESLRRNPYQPEVLATLGAVYYQFLGDSSRGIDCYRRAIQLDPDNAAVRISLGYAYVGHNEPDLAREQFQQILRAAPDAVPALLAMARLDLQLQHKPRAIERLRHVLRLEPQNQHARSCLQELGEPLD